MYKRMFGTVCLMLALLNGSQAVPVSSNGIIEFDGVKIDPSTSPSLDFENYRGDQSADTFFLVQVTPQAVRDAAKTFDSMFSQYIPENAYIIKTNFTYAKLLAQSPQVTYVNLLPAASKVTTRLENTLKRVTESDDTSAQTIEKFFAEELKEIDAASVKQVRRGPTVATTKKSALSVAGQPSVAHILPASQKHRAVVLGAASSLAEVPVLAVHMLEAPVSAPAPQQQGFAPMSVDPLASRNAAVQSALNNALANAYGSVTAQAATNPAIAGAVASLAQVDAQADVKALASSSVLPMTILVAPADASVSPSATMPVASSLSFHSPLFNVSPSAIAKSVVAAARDAVLKKATPLASQAAAPSSFGPAVSAPLARPSALRAHLDTIAASLTADAASAPLATLSEGQKTIALARSMAAVLDIQRAAVNKVLADTVSSLAELPHVLTVDVKPRIKSHNLRAKFLATVGSDAHIAKDANDANNLYHAAGVRGSGITVGVGDTGVDVRSCYFRDGSTSVPYNTVDMSARKVVQYITYGDNGDYEEGHGTHVSGTIAGNSNSGLVGDSRYDGVAPDAKLAMYDFADVNGNFYVPDNLASVFSDAWKANGFIHSDSWGCSKDRYDPHHACNVYDASAFYVDKWMQEHDKSLIVIANGNDGDYSYGSVGSPATAKNALSIGALSNSATSFAENGQGDSTKTKYSEKAMASFSSLGPTTDRRIKPDVVAPGFALTSARASGTTSQSCATTVMGGTSMATPTVSGTAALLTDYLTKGLHASPAAPMSVVRGTLLKAILVNSAQKVPFHAADVGTVNMPMKVQTGSILAPIGSYEHILLGELTSVFDLGFTSGKTATLYFKPSAGGSVNRTYRLMVNDGCGATYSASFGADSNANAVTRSGGSTPYEPSPMDYSTTTSTATVYVKVTGSIDFGSCDFLNIGVLEYDASTVAAAPSYATASCSDKASAWPTFDHNVNMYDANNDPILPTYRFSCPAAPACSDAHSFADVKGTTGYTIDSSICRAALHSAAVSTADAHVVVASGDLPAWVANKPRGMVNVELSLLNVDATDYASVAGEVANGVTSYSAKIYGGQRYFALSRAGAATTPGNVVSSTPFPNDIQDIANADKPNIVSGFGKVTLATAAPLGTPSSGAARKLVILSDGSKTMTHESARVQCFTIGATAQATTMNTGTAAISYNAGPDDVKVTLVWNDYAGFPTSSKRTLVNDLDLFVYHPTGDEYRGNGRVDKRNTVEQVTLPAQYGVFCAAVHGAYVPLGEAKYSLVVNGRDAKACAANPIIPDTTGEQVNTVAGRYTRTNTPTCTVPEFSAQMYEKYDILQMGDCSIIRAAPIQDLANTCDVKAGGFFGLRVSGCDDSTYTVAELGQGSSTRGAAMSMSGSVNTNSVACAASGYWYDANYIYEACFDRYGTATITLTLQGTSTSCYATYGTDTTKTVMDAQSEVVYPAQYLIPVPTIPNSAVSAQTFVGVMCAFMAVLAMLW